MDLVTLLFVLALEAPITATFVVVALTYLTFRRLNKEVRRARMYLLADRFDRFLAAFTVAFMVFAVSFAVSFLGSIFGASLSAAILVGFFVFLGGILYASLEIFFVIRPRARTKAAPVRWPSAHTSRLHAVPEEASSDAPK